MISEKLFFPVQSLKGTLSGILIQILTPDRNIYNINNKPVNGFLPRIRNNRDS